MEEWVCFIDVHDPRFNYIDDGVRVAGLNQITHQRTERVCRHFARSVVRNFFRGDDIDMVLGVNLEHGCEAAMLPRIADGEIEGMIDKQAELRNAGNHSGSIPSSVQMCRKVFIASRERIASTRLRRFARAARSSGRAYGFLSQVPEPTHCRRYARMVAISSGVMGPPVKYRCTTGASRPLVSCIQ